MIKRSDKILLEPRIGRADVFSRLKLLAAKQGFAALATISAQGPQLSLVAFALSPDLHDVCFATPKNTNKYRNIMADPRVSLLLDSRKKRGLSGVEALALSGRARLVRRGKKRDELVARLLVRHPELDDFLRAPGTAVISIELEWASHVEDFQRLSEAGPLLPSSRSPPPRP